MANIDNIDIEKILAESKRTRLGLEGASYVPGNTTYQAKEYVLPSSSQYNVSSYQYTPSNYTYQPQTYQPQPEVQTNYQTFTVQQPEIRSSQTENVKRAGLHESVKVINSGGSTVNGRLNIIMLGAEIERLLELGRDMDYSYNQLNIEIVTIRETLSFKEREIIDLRGRGDNSSELKNILNAKEREILLLKSNMGNEVPVANPDIENLRKRLKNLEFEVSELTRKSNAIQNEVNQILAQIGKGRQARANANNKKQNTAWCC